MLYLCMHLPDHTLRARVQDSNVGQLRLMVSIHVAHRLWELVLLLPKNKAVRNLPIAGLRGMQFE